MRLIAVFFLLFTLNTVIGQKALVKDLMLRRSAIYFEELHVHFYEGLLKANPYYPYRGDFLTEQQTSALDHEFDKFPAHQVSSELYYIDYYYITEDKVGLLFRRSLGGPEKTIFLVIWDLKEGDAANYIPLAAKYAYEGSISEQISLIRDINDDGVLDFLSISYAERSGLDTFSTYATYETGIWNNSTCSYNFLESEPVNSDFTWMDLNKNSLDFFYEHSHTLKEKPEHWVILLDSFSNIDEATSAAEALYETKREKKRDYTYPLEYKDISIFASTEQFLVVLNGFGNKNQASIFLREVRDYFYSKATVKNFTDTCPSWEFSCEPRCHYYCQP